MQTFFDRSRTAILEDNGNRDSASSADGGRDADDRDSAGGSRNAHGRDNYSGNRDADDTDGCDNTDNDYNFSTFEAAAASKGGCASLSAFGSRKKQKQLELPLISPIAESRDYAFLSVSLCSHLQSAE
jgi:hypothetical protein